MKLKFTLGRISTAIVASATLIAVLLGVLVPSEVTIVIAVLAVVAFHTCSISDAFDKAPEVAWLVAIASIVVTICVFVAKIVLAIFFWMVALVTNTPPAKFMGKKF